MVAIHITPQFMQVSKGVARGVSVLSNLGPTSAFASFLLSQQGCLWWRKRTHIWGTMLRSGEHRLDMLLLFRRINVRDQSCPLGEREFWLDLSQAAQAGSVQEV